MKKRVLALTLAAAMLTALPGCGEVEAAEAVDLMEGVTAAPVQASWEPGQAAALAEFSLRLFQAAAKDGENTLLSPYSIVSALGMTANGASGETLAQMEEAFGLTVPEMNALVQTWIRNPDEELKTVNSIWFREKEGLTVEQSFLQANADWYGAEAYQIPFDDGGVKAINSWVNEGTDGQIPTVLDEIPEEAVMYLINALSFDAEWQQIYETTQIHDGTFTTESGVKRTVELMYNGERTFLEDENATGFLKYYAGGRYAFAALLPRAGVSVDSYLDSLTGEGLMEVLSGARSCLVQTAIPKFEVEYSTELREALMTLGMEDAFDPARADFTALGHDEDGPLCISQVLHKTALTLDERGTRAGAVTAVEMVAGSAAPGEEEIQQVYLDRPFVYLIVDTETDLPLFLGTAMDLGA